MTTAEPLEILYFSDVLCVWAYAGQIRLDTLREDFGPRIRVVERFLNVYGDVHRRVADKAGKSKNPPAFYARQMRSVAARFEHTKMHEDAFQTVLPRSSNQAHLVLSAVRALADDGTIDAASEPVRRLARRVRSAFFEEALDIGRLDVLFGLLEAEGLPRGPVEESLADGRAMAELSQDLLQKDTHRIVGSPTYVLDGGREKLFGNVGYRIIEANVTELLEAGDKSGASWC